MEQVGKTKDECPSHGLDNLNEKKRGLNAEGQAMVQGNAYECQALENARHYLNGILILLGNPQTGGLAVDFHLNLPKQGL